MAVMKSTNPYKFYNGKFMVGLHTIPVLFFESDSVFEIHRICDIIFNIEPKKYYPVLFASIHTGEKEYTDVYMNAKIHPNTSNIVYHGILFMEYEDVKWFKRWIGIATYKEAKYWNRLQISSELVLSNMTGLNACNRWRNLAYMIRAFVQVDMYLMADKHE